MNEMVFDSIVIGAGQAGPSLAVTLANRGEKVALIETDRLGGTCINNGCTPTKTLRKSARVAYLARRASEFGVETGPIRVDFGKAMARMRERVDTSRAGLDGWVRGNGVAVFSGHGRIAGRDGDAYRVTVGDQVIRAAKLFLNTGTRPFMPPIPGLAEVPALDNRSLLGLDTLPRHLVIIGGSYIGLEMAQIFRRLGAEVSVIEGGPALASREDPDISAMIREFLEAEGIAVHTGVKIQGVSGEAGTITVQLEGTDVTGSHLLVATGRIPNTDDLGLETIDLQTGPRGHIDTNHRLETAVPSIWALGDINGRGAFTHTSYHDFEIVAENLAGGTRSADDRVMAYAMFTDPPLGHVGIHRYEAQKLADEGRNILIAEHDMKDVSRAKEESELTGRIRIIVDGADGAVLGATILGINGDEIVQTFSNFIAAGGHWINMRDALPVHPTVTEFMPTILAKLKPLLRS
jgi:pyruvate/2-oxoglutarate dehydrogenase complex dihydrolipoamide dehydrogenase (E3) component